MQVLNKYNKTVLNCEYIWGEEKMNWLLMKVYKKDLLEFSIREAQYDLIKTNFDFYDMEDWNIKWDLNNNLDKNLDQNEAYILVAKDEMTIDKWIPFSPYHDNVRQWAYSIWEYFWLLFDKSTCLNK